jgi:hypothetical protein
MQHERIERSDTDHGVHHENDCLPDGAASLLRGETVGQEYQQRNRLKLDERRHQPHRRWTLRSEIESRFGAGVETDEGAAKRSHEQPCA